MQLNPFGCGAWSRSQGFAPGKTMSDASQGGEGGMPAPRPGLRLSPLGSQPFMRPRGAGGTPHPGLRAADPPAVPAPAGQGEHSPGASLAPQSVCGARAAARNPREPWVRWVGYGVMGTACRAGLCEHQTVGAQGGTAAGQDLWDPQLPSHPTETPPSREEQANPKPGAGCTRWR